MGLKLSAAAAAPRRSWGLPSWGTWVGPSGVVAAMSLYAGAIHLWASPEHLGVWWGYGAFFLAIGLAQVAFPVLLAIRPSPGLLVGGLGLNLGIVLVWLLSRTAGIPIGPGHVHGHGGSILQVPNSGVEAVSAIDLAASGAELVLVAAVLPMLDDRRRRVLLNVLLVGGVALWVLRLTGGLA